MQRAALNLGHSSVCIAGLLACALAFPALARESEATFRPDETFRLPDGYDEVAEHGRAQRALEITETGRADDGMVLITLRNTADRSITAWSVVGRREAVLGSTGRDNGFRHGDVLRPGAVVTFNSGFEPGTPLEIGAVVFEGGTFTGSDVRALQSWFDHRFIRTVAAFEARAILRSQRHEAPAEALRSVTEHHRANTAIREAYGPVAAHTAAGVRKDLLSLYLMLREQGRSHDDAIAMAWVEAEYDVLHGLRQLPESLRVEAERRAAETSQPSR